MKSIHNLHYTDWPREKLQRLGAKALTDIELMAIMLGSGTKKCNVVQLASIVLKVIDSRGEITSPDALKCIEGLGPAKSTLLLAAREFFRRRLRETRPKISTAKEVLPLISYLQDKPQEHFVSIALNGAAEVISTCVVTVGLANKIQIHPREVFAGAITERACAIIVAHNHPADSLEPSQADIKTTKLLKRAGDLLGITLIDHLIFNRLGFYSFRDAGLL